MATKTIFLWILVCQRFITTHTTTGFLDFSELQSVNYGIDIVGNPVVRGEADPDSVYLTSIYGQQYQCQIPDVVSDDQREKEEEKTALETGIPELLRPMKEGPCLVHTKDWWTYEFCYGDTITQFHLEDGKISGDITVLGTYKSDFDWSNSTHEKSKNRLSRFHSQEYVNGSRCDLTGKERQAQVRFVCELGHGDYIARIEEPATCVYTLFVHTSKLCHHPYLKPRMPKQPVQIQCRPLLTAEEYVEYEEEMEAKRKEEEEFRAYQKLLQKKKEEEALARQAALALKEDQLSEDLDEGTSDIDDETVPETSSEVTDVTETSADLSEEGLTESGDADLEETVAALQDIFTESLAKGLQDILEENGYTGPELAAKQDDKLYYEPEKSTKEEKEKPKPKPKHTVVKPVDITKRQLSEEEARKSWSSIDTTEQTVYEEVDQEGRKRTFLRDREGTMVVIQKDPNFGTPTIEEIDADSAVVSEDSDPSLDVDEDLMKAFDKELDNILDEHPDRERLAKYKDTIESAVTAQFNDIVNEAAQEMNDDPLEPAERNQALKSLGTTLNKLLEKLDTEDESSSTTDADDDDDDGDDDDEEPGEDEILDEDEEAETTDTETETGTELTEKTTISDDRVRVRLTRIKEVPKGAGDGEGGDIPKMPGEIQIPEEQKAQLESKMKTELEKAGMDTSGRKIEVKIITAGYYDSDSEQLHILNDEESNAFNNMIITILQGHSEADKEERHQISMQQNYAFQWGNRKKKTPTL